MNKPLISIISGYYNRKENLRESVQSILDQDYPNFEFIVFDDCSTDGTTEIIKSFEDPRLKVICHEKNMGFTRGVISAIAQSKGEFIAIHGAGDISRKKRISLQADYLIKHSSVGIVSCDREQFDEKKRWRIANTDKTMNFRKALFFKNPIVQGDVMFRRSVYERAGGYDSWITYAQDRDLWLRMSRYTDYHCLPEILYERGLYKESVSNNLHKKIQQRFFTCLARERELKGHDFNLLFRDKYQVVADEAVALHFTRRDGKSREQLLRVCRQESHQLRNRLYYYAYWIPGLSHLIYRWTARKLFRKKKFLERRYREMSERQIYEVAVLGRNWE